MIETSTPPEKISPRTVVYWSSSLRRLEGIKQGNAIKTKALNFLKKGLVTYDKELRKFKVLPIAGYNKTTHLINDNLECDCQFYSTISKGWDNPTCSHNQAVKLYLEIKRWNNEAT